MTDPDQLQAIEDGEISRWLAERDRLFVVAFVAALSKEARTKEVESALQAAFKEVRIFDQAGPLNRKSGTGLFLGLFGL